MASGLGLTILTNSPQMYGMWQPQLHYNENMFVFLEENHFPLEQGWETPVLCCRVKISPGLCLFPSSSTKLQTTVWNSTLFPILCTTLDQSLALVKSNTLQREQGVICDVLTVWVRNKMSENEVSTKCFTGKPLCHAHTHTQRVRERNNKSWDVVSKMPGWVRGCCVSSNGRLS